MEKDYTVRIIKTELEYFKNVQYGEIKYMNYRCAEKNAALEHKDIVGIYGQNGSGKTAMIEALDILQRILSGEEIRYHEFEGLLDDEGRTKITVTFFIEHQSNVYKAEYRVNLTKSISDKKIQIAREEISYWRRGTSWKTKRSLMFNNPFYNPDSILQETEASVQVEGMKYVKHIPFLNAIQNLAIYCAQKNVSIFFNDITVNNLMKSQEADDLETMILYDVIRGLSDFGRLYFQVVKVNQLGAINHNKVLPVNVHRETGNSIIQGCLPMFMSGHADIDEEMFHQLCYAMDAINIALKAIIPNLKIEIVKSNEEIDKDGKRIIQIDVYSIREGKRFLTKYESEGIKRIISLLNYFIAFYHSSQICLVVDELDSGIFEYLLGELLGVFSQEAKGQLIFTSHNLRILEKLDNVNIVCSTINPKNRYIRLQGIEKNNNKRDFYIRAIVLGGQKEELYNDADLQSIGYAFRKAGRKNKSAKLKLSPQMQELLSDNAEEDRM